MIIKYKPNDKLLFYFFDNTLSWSFWWFCSKTEFRWFSYWSS